MSERTSGSEPGEGANARALPAWSVWGLSAGVAFVFRLLYVLTMRDSVAFDLPIMDEAVHDLWARGHAPMFHEGIPYFRAPLYPWFLQAIYALDPGYLWPRLVQALLSALTVGFVADAARRLASPGAGLASGLLLAVCWPVIFFSGELLIVTLFVAILIPALWLLVRASQEDRPLLALGGALLIGIAAMARPTALTFLPALVLLPAWTWRRAGLARLGRAAPRWILAMLALALLPGLVLTVRNKVVGDDWVFLASQGGVNFYIGNNPESDGRTAVVPGTSSTWLGGYAETIQRAEAAEGRSLKPSEVSRWYTRRGLDYLRQEPADALALYARKARLLLGAGERGNNKNLHWWRHQNPVLRLPIYTDWAILFALGLTGLFLLRRQRAATPIWMFLGLYALGLLLFFVNERFRTPLTVVLAIPAGVPVAVVAGALRAREFRRVGAVVGLAAVLFGATTLDRLDYREHRIDADAFSRYSMGNMHLRKRQYEPALRWYQESLAVAREFRLRHFEQVEFLLRQNMVRALLGTQRLEEAEMHVEWLEATAPDALDTKVLRGRLHLWNHEYSQAFEFFRAVLDVAPDHAEALIGLGWCQLENGAYETASRSFRRANQRGGDDPQALAGLGVAELLGNENRRRARQYFERALALDWNTAQAHQYLGEMARVDRDIGPMLYHLREALRLDPKNLGVRRFLTRSGAGFEHTPEAQPPEHLRAFRDR